jgi:hypothetical protein
VEGRILTHPQFVGFGIIPVFVHVGVAVALAGDTVKHAAMIYSVYLKPHALASRLLRTIDETRTGFF